MKKLSNLEIIELLQSKNISVTDILDAITEMYRKNPSHRFQNNANEIESTRIKLFGKKI